MLESRLNKLPLAVQELIKEALRKPLHGSRTEEGLHLRFDWIKRYAAARGGVCLNPEGTLVHSVKTEVRLQCERGHQWSTTYSILLSDGSWCKKCSQRHLLLGIEVAREAARLRNGVCLSTEYLGNNKKLTWMCERGHQWQTTLQKVRDQGHWCNACHLDSVRRSFSELEPIIQSHGGVFLGKPEDYRSGVSKLLMRCSQGHVFKTTGVQLRAGSWCAACATAKQRKYSLVDLHALAKAWGGVCHSQVYAGSVSFYDWECEHGHRWRYAWGNMLKNYSPDRVGWEDKVWCPECRAKKLAADRQAKLAAQRARPRRKRR